MIQTLLRTPEQIVEEWHLYKDFLKKALDHSVNETPLSFWLQRLMNYQAQLWIAIDNNTMELKGVALTQFIDYVTHKTLHIVHLSGIGFDEWADQYGVLEEFARKNNCKAVEQWGRPGWSKILPQKIPGFKTVYHVMRKEID